jgi:putative membrane protein
MSRKLLIAALLVLPSTAFAASTAHFMKDAIDGDYSEMTLGKLIQQKGSSAQVRDFGAMLVTDHRQGLAQAQQLADRKHLNIKPAMMPEAKTEQSKLQHLQGAAFDREVKRYMVQDHEKDIAKFKAQVGDRDHDVSAFAKATIPVLEKHLKTAQSIRA